MCLRSTAQEHSINPDTFFFHFSLCVYVCGTIKTETKRFAGRHTHAEGHVSGLADDHRI